MIDRIKYLFGMLIIIPIISIGSIAQKATPDECRLPIDQSPKLFGFQLGMSPGEVSKILNSIVPSTELTESDDTEIVDIIQIDGKYTEYWSLFIKDPQIALSGKRETKHPSIGVKRMDYNPEKDPQLASKAQVAGMSSMTFYFYENKLFKFSATFPEKDWLNEKELGQSIGKQLAIATNYWKFDKYGGKLDCGSFSIQSRDMGGSGSAALKAAITKNGLKRFDVSMENSKIEKDLTQKAIDLVLEKENKLVDEVPRTKQKDRHLREFVVTTLNQLDSYPEDFVGKNVYFIATPQDVVRVSEGFFSVGLSTGGITAYRSDFKYVSSVYGKSGLNIVAYKGYPSWLEAFKGQDTLIGVTISQNRSNYSDFYEATIFDISDFYIPKSEGGYSDANAALIGRTLAEIQLFPSAFSKERIAGLLKEGADINIKDINGRTPLILASRSPDGAAKRIRTYIEWGARIDDVDAEGKSALIYAVIAESKDVVKELIKGNANTSIRDKNGKTAVDYARIAKNSKGLLSLFKD